MITTPTLDDFQRADENPLSQAGNWSATVQGNGSLDLIGTYTSTLQLNSSIARNQGVFNFAASSRVATVPAGDCEVWGEWTGDVGAGGELAGVCMHLDDADTSSITGYWAICHQFVGGFAWGLWRFDSAGSKTELDVDLNNEPLILEDDIMLMRRVGTDIEVWHYTAADDTWAQILDATDTTYTGGSLGLQVGTDDGGWTRFGGGAPQVFIPQIMRYV